MHDSDQDGSIIGRDADAARGPKGTRGEGLAEDLNATTSEAAGGTVAPRKPGADTDFDIVFEGDETDS